MITDKILKNLEYDKILKEISKFAKLSGGKEGILSETPQTTFEDSVSMLKFTHEAFAILFIHCEKPLKNAGDTKELLARARVLSALEITDIIRVGRLLNISREFDQTISKINAEIPMFLSKARELYQDYDLEAKILDIFISDEEIADHASPTLFELRKKKRKINNDIKKVLQSYVQDKETSKYLQDKIVTTRKDRFVVPVRIEYRSFVKGLVQDYSQTGSTVFVEPMEVVEKNNELRAIEIEEKLEIERILIHYTSVVCDIAPQLLQTQRTLDEFDIALSKAEYAAATRSVMPRLNDKGKIDIKRGRHPIIDPQKVVPVSIGFGKDARYLLISGPNTGGKTVTMKMVGLFSLLAMSGIFISAGEGSEISFFESIFSDIGDEQSIENDLSTFSSHIVTLKEIMENVNDKSLVLIDELGGGTDPDEGSALALSVLEDLITCGSTGILTTHYGKLKEFSYTRDEIQNASMQFDEDSYRPTYKLILGTAGNSKALEIAENLGIPEYIITRAKSHISDDKKNFDLIIDNARKEMMQAEKLREDAQKLHRQLEEEKKSQDILKAKLEKERDRITEIARIEARRIIAQASEEANELVEEIKSIKQNSDITQKEVIEAGKLKNKLKSKVIEEDDDDFNEADYEAFDINRSKIGQYVFVKTIGSIGKITKINTKKKEVVVQVGMVEVSAKSVNILRPLREIVPKAPPEKKRHTFTHKSAAPKYGSLVELNIIGKRVHEGVSEVQQFLDDAYLRRTDKVRIIHGMGTGKLKEGVWEELARNKHVKEYKLAEYTEGGAGATVVIFK
ncbi:MAG: endonuclease MutS2 [Bacillota bacterium]